MFRLIALCVCLFATAAVAADVPSATKTFIDKVAVSNKFEIDTSELPLKYGKSADVKAFAQQMIDDHKKAGADFKTSLAQANIEPPADSLDVSHTAKYAKLRLFTTEKGFDSAYVDAQLGPRGCGSDIQGLRRKRPHAGVEVVCREDIANSRTLSKW